MRSAAIAMDCKPEAQKRLTVMAEELTGRPARRAAMRATFIPCSASGMAQPRITSSISLRSRWGRRASAPSIAVAARSSGRVVANAPRPDLPTAVRMLLAITASLIFASLPRGRSAETQDYILRYCQPSPSGLIRGGLGSHADSRASRFCANSNPSKNIPRG